MPAPLAKRKTRLSEVLDSHRGPLYVLAPEREASSRPTPRERARGRERHGALHDLGSGGGRGGRGGAGGDGTAGLLRGGDGRVGRFAAEGGGGGGGEAKKSQESQPESHSESMPRAITRRQHTRHTRRVACVVAVTLKLKSRRPLGLQQLGWQLPRGPQTK